jgi:hypothetical protein
MAISLADGGFTTLFEIIGARVVALMDEVDALQKKAKPSAS